MNNIRIIETGIDVSRLLQEVKSLPEESWVKHSKNANHRVLPLTVPVIYDPKFAGILDSNETTCTKQYFTVPNIITWLRRRGYQHHTWSGIYRLPPGGVVPWHVDDTGKYYEKKMRYHLCLQGTYIYRVKGDPDHTITPGTFFWFDLQTMHSAECVSTDDRITLLFDLPAATEINNP